MKNVKFLFWIAMVVLVATTSCKKDNDLYLYEDFDTEIGTETNTGNTNEQGDEGALTLYEVVNGNIIKVKDFQVPDRYKSFQADEAKHQEMWDYFAQLIPEDERRFITEFEVFHGENEILGYVTPINDNDLSRWKMGMAIDAAGNLGRVDLSNDYAYTCIHEYAHVMTLSHLQVDVATGESQCNNYFVGEGCANADSYIQRIFEIGWADIINEHNQLQTDDEIFEFYDKYEDRFVTEYAATNPAEDIAEVFTTFVTMDTRPTGNSIADRKVLAMYDYPELVQVRDEIRAQPALRTLKPGSWVKSRKKRRCGRKGCSHHASALGK